MGYSNVNDHASDWMSQTLYEQMPAELRSVLSKTNVRLSLPFDWMQKSLPRTDVIAPYLKSWHVAINVDGIKTTLKMDILPCKRPEMVRKDIAINFLNFLVCNLIRALVRKNSKIE